MVHHLSSCFGLGLRYPSTRVLWTSVLGLSRCLTRSGFQIFEILLVMSCSRARTRLPVEPVGAVCGVQGVVGNAPSAMRQLTPNIRRPAILIEDGRHPNPLDVPRLDDRHKGGGEDVEAERGTENIATPGDRDFAIACRLLETGADDHTIAAALAAVRGFDTKCQGVLSPPNGLLPGDDIVVTVPGSKTNPAEDGAGGRQSGRRLPRRALARCTGRGLLKGSRCRSSDWQPSALVAAPAAAGRSHGLWRRGPTVAGHEAAVSDAA